MNSPQGQAPAEATSASSYFLDVLAQPAPLAAFDAFKKTAPTYKERTARGGILTVLIALAIGVLVWAEAVRRSRPCRHTDAQLTAFDLARRRSTSTARQTMSSA